MPKKEIETKSEVITESTELSYDTKTLLTVITLVTVYPVGLILMFAWMKWNKWIKILVALPVLMMVLIPMMMLLIAAAVAVKVISEPEVMDTTFDEIKTEMRKEIINEITISPVQKDVIPTKMAIKPTIKIVK